MRGVYRRAGYMQRSFRQHIIHYLTTSKRGFFLLQYNIASQTDFTNKNKQKYRQTVALYRIIGNLLEPSYASTDGPVASKNGLVNKSARSVVLILISSNS